MSLPEYDAPTKVPARTWKIAAVVGAAAFMAMLDSTVVNLALASIARDFGRPLSLIQWVATGYLVALAVSLPTAGWLGRRYGYGRVWSVSVACFVVTSGLCGLAQGSSTLIVARLLQGLAAGVMVPAGQAVIGSTTRSDQLGRVMGTLGLVIALGPAVGPGIGGFLLEIMSWRWLFWINIPIGIVALAASWGLVPRGTVNARLPLDRIGFVLIGFGLPLFLYGATRFGSGSVSLSAAITVAIGAILTIGFVLTELRIQYPLIDLRLLHRRLFSAATVTSGLSGANMYGGLLLLPLYLQLETHQTVGETGLMLLVMGLGSAAILPIAGTLTDRYGASRIAMAGAGILIVTTIPFVILPGQLSTSALIVLLLSRGVGIALAQMPAMTAAYASVTTEQMGDATTLVNMVQRIGGAIGAVGVVILLTLFGDTASLSAYVFAFAVLTALAVLMVISASVMKQ